MSSSHDSPTPSPRINVEWNTSTPPPQSPSNDGPSSPGLSNTSAHSSSSQKTASFWDRWTAVTKDSNAKWNGLCATLQAMRYMYIAPESNDESFVPDPIDWDAVQEKITQHRDCYERTLGTLGGTDEQVPTPTVVKAAFTELKRDFRSLRGSLVGDDEVELSCLDRRDWINRGHCGISDLADAARKMLGGVEDDYEVMEGVLKEFGSFDGGA